MSAPAYRARVAALLAYVTESRLIGAPVAPVRADSPWDIWWVCYRAQTPVPDLGLRVWAHPGACGRCFDMATALTHAGPVRHPDSLTQSPCACLVDWAKLMRAAGGDTDWPPLRASVAMVKPGGDAPAVLRTLSRDHLVTAVTTRSLTASDARRLYPDAYGAEYVARQDDYLTSSPVTVYALLLNGDAARRPKDLKLGIRAQLADGDVLRNQLHMPDSPGDALCDLAHLISDNTRDDLYGRYDRVAAEHRIARYRDCLDFG
ncbi:hypothetical protein ACFUYE_03920 [Micromonospora humida]|uniref:hypothetical protein n=1 Tax=Micromonospora humida TaxID=2809018 RepID=UPI003671384F